MKSFGSRLLIDPDTLTGALAATWSSTVVGNLHELDASCTGRCLIHFINAGSQPVVIQPYLDTGDRKNAYAAADDERRADYPGRPMRRADNGELVSGGGYGSGTGSSVHVRFTPWRWTAAGNRSVTLLHELVHAAQQAYGVVYYNKLAYKFDTQAEFDAILVENVYRSETGGVLRRNHWGWDELKGPMVPAAAGYARLVNSFRARTPGLARGLAGVDTAFNPFRPGATGYVPSPSC